MCNGAYINIEYRSIFGKIRAMYTYISTSNNNSRTSMRDMYIYIYTPQKKYLNQTEPNPLGNSNISWNSPCKSKVLRLLKNSCCQKYQGFLLVVGYRWNRGGWTWKPGNLETSRIILPQWCKKQHACLSWTYVPVIWLKHHLKKQAGCCNKIRDWNYHA